MTGTFSTELNKIIKRMSIEATVQLPKLHNNDWEFAMFDRKFMGRTIRSWALIPFYPEIYLDNHPNKTVRAGRQTHKTTYAADKVASRSTRQAGVEVTYVADNEPHKSAFSRQRYRRECMLANDNLKAFLPHGGRAAVDTIELLNDSVVYMVTDEGEYKNVEGKSNAYLVFDESQYHDLQFLSHATYSLTQTHGQFETLGIGGEAGSEWDNRWLSSDQRHWVYDDTTDYTDPSTGRVWTGQGWRHKLRFNNDGIIINTPEELKVILAGKWVAQNPDATEIRGYWLPQEIFATIPLTRHSAINEYQIPASISVEWQEQEQPRSIYLSHCRGESYKAERRPITTEMVKACMRPYEYLNLLSGDEVKELKRKYGNELRVLGGIDFGSSTTTPTTVLAILLHWRKSKRYQLAFIEKIAQTDHPYDKARHIAETFAAYGVDIAVGDIGHGQDMVPVIQEGGRDSQDRPFEGLGKSVFYSCRTISDETKPQMEKQQDSDEEGTELGRFQIDKTTIIQQFIDFIGWNLDCAHIREPWRELTREDEPIKVPKLMIPYAKNWEVDFLVKEWVKLTRKDLEKVQEGDIEDGRQRNRKEFNHPPDSMMALIYCMVGDNNYDEGSFSINRIKRKRN